MLSAKIALVAVTLRLFFSPREAFEDAVDPWLAGTGARAWQRPLPSLVIVPTRSHANALKQRSLRAGRSHFGLHFITPSTLREMLRRDDPTPSPRDEDLRLLLALTAAELPDDLTAKAVTRSPGALLRSLNRLQLAGWDFEQLTLPTFAPLVRRFRALLRKCDFDLPGANERERLAHIGKSSPRFADLLITGFDAAHWGDWFLLRSAVALAENATVILEEPQHLQEIDLCWIGSWEEIGGEARRSSTALISATPDALFSEAEMRGENATQPRVDFLIAFNYSEQAEAIAHQCLSYLLDENCTRLGIVFTGAGALPRLVSAALARLGVPHNDNIAHIVPGIFEEPDWRAWLELQRAPRLESLLHFVNALPDFAPFAPENFGRSSFERTLRKHYADLLLDDLDILRAACAAADNEKSQLTARTLESFPLLPARATYAEFLEQTHAAFAHFRWSQRIIELRFTDRDWARRLPNEFSRSLFLRWLEETASTFRATRAATGDHPYARVHLLTVAHAQNQEWSHLIFAGWNDGAWPPPAGADFARDEEIRAFNQSAQQLNKRAARQGNQGEGHAAIRDGHSLYLGPIEQRAIALRQFQALRESATEALTLTASLVHEDAPERLWNPSECFARLYQQTRNEPLTQAALKQLQQTTALLPEEIPATVDVAQTQIAFAARRDATRPAGEYDFALRPNESPTAPPVLSVSDLETMVKAPAIIWMRRYLGVEEPDDNANPWMATTGKWVHRWLADIAETKEGKLFTRFPRGAQIDERVRASADAERDALQKLCRSLGKAIPDWWTSGWLNARYLARHLGGKMAGAEGWPWMVAEFPIGREGPVSLPGDITLPLRGRIDLILAQEETADFTNAIVWVVDYKTGSTKKLSTGQLHDTLVKGSTLQLGLYALALRALGAAEVSASILSSAIKDVSPQMEVSELLPHTNVFADLAEMHRTGVFGMKGELRAAFGFAPTYPLATLAIDPDVLEDKWALTHPNLVLEREEWEVF